MFNDFTNLYPVSKTLKFELIPQGRTLENIKSKGLLKKDSIRAAEYKQMKGIIDEYHKAFIDSSLEGASIEGLTEYYNLYCNNDSDENILEEHERAMRKHLSQIFKTQPAYKTLFKADLIKKDLPGFVKDEEEKRLIKRFEKFTTYFSGYHQNRENMYSDEAKQTAIANRIINENLPVFIFNMKAFELLKNSEIARDFSKIEKDLELILQVNHLEEMFEIEYFNQTITQRGIDVYNQILGGYSEETLQHKGLNQYINEFNQTAEMADRLPTFKPLYKQILSDSRSFSFVPEVFNSDNEIIESIAFFWDEYGDVIEKQKALLNQLNDFVLQRVFIKNDASLSQISQGLFSDWSKLKGILSEAFDKKPENSKLTAKKLSAERKKYFKNTKSFSVEEINSALNLYSEAAENVTSYFRISPDNALIKAVEVNAERISPLLKNGYPEDKQLLRDQKTIDIIKGFLDSIMKWKNFIKPLLGSGKEANKDSLFYSKFDQYWEELNNITLLYNRVRNYLTKKPYSEEKIKLNFDNPALLSGWSASKESERGGVLLFKDDKYYLAIMDKGSNKVFKNAPASSSSEFYKKMDYNLLPSPNKMLPKVFFAAGNLKTYSPSDKILEIYKKGSFKKGKNFSLDDCHTLIDFFKESIKKYSGWDVFNFKFSETNTYSDISEFYREVEEQGYDLSYRSIDAAYIDENVEKGNLYLFQIYNKDFSKNSKGKENLHTMYWKMLFDERNARDVIYKLNGDAEMFYRPASLKDPVVHKANEAIKNKNPLNKKSESLFTYDIIKDKRYTEDKFFFHVPISMNFKSKRNEMLNGLARKSIQAEKEVYTIGIKRAEKHLLYYCVVNGKGEIVEQGSLNSIKNTSNGQMYETNYNELLSRREEERDKARKNWASIKNIKELKTGYLSQVVHKVVSLMTKYNGVVVIEDLSFNFVKERQKIEKQIYQKFDKMLIDKLSFLVDKNTDADKAGGLLHAYQLATPNAKGNQSGFLFRVQPAYTTQLDPTTGFVNLFYVKYTNKKTAFAFFEKFDEISYNEKEDYFEFTFDYNRFTDKAEGTKTKWTVCTHGNRVASSRNVKNGRWEYETIDLTKEFKALFESYEIDYRKNLKEQILLCDEASFLKELMNLFRLTVQMRNNEIDDIHIISPIKNKFGYFYNTKDEAEGLPENAAANGAYNIAMKGQYYVELIKNAPEEELNKIKLSMKNVDWLTYMQR